MDARLLAAVENGDVEEVHRITTQQLPAGEARRLLQQQFTPEGDGLLHIAARFGHHNLVQPLFNIALQVMPVGQPWWGPDFWRSKNKSGQTCLHEAIRHGCTEFVRHLLNHDDTLLLQYDRRRSLGLVQMEDGEGMSPLYLATTLHKLDIIRILLDQERVHPATYGGPQGRTAMHAAVVTDSIAICEELLIWNDPGTGRDLIRRADETGSTPLHYIASSHNKFDIAERLFVAGDISDNNGSLPIHVAAAQGRLDIIELLLDKFPDSLWSRDSSGQTLLHVAVGKEMLHVVAYICRQDNQRFTTILNASDQEGNTALHLALRSGNPDTFRQLIRKREVDLNITNRNGHTPLDLLFLSGKVHHRILESEGRIVSSVAISSGHYTLRYFQNGYDWMAYDLIVAGASRSPRRWDHFTTQLPQVQDMDKEWDKLGKSASVLAVCAVLILNAAIALPFNVAARFHEQPHTPRRSLAFRGFLASDAVAFLSSGIATFCCTYAGFAQVQNLRLSFLYCGAGCLIAASLAIVGAFALGMYAAFTTGLVIFPTLAVLLAVVGILGNIILPLRQTYMHNRALIARLGFRVFLRSLLRGNRRMFYIFIGWHRVTIAVQFGLFSYCTLSAISILQHRI